jgi:glycyl-tRNA synthetase beta chain
MPQLLLELFSEEIPARMQARAEADLARLLMDRLTGAGFLPEGVKAFSTPRRIAVVADGLPLRQPDMREERKGPRVGAPDKAIEGFLRGAGLKSIDQARVAEDAKGAFYVADIEKKGAETAAVIAQVVPDIIRSFPWPKSMRSGTSDLYWVRPLQSILCAFDGEAVPIALDDVPCGRSTEGHRFMAPGRFEVRRFEDYRDALIKHRVVLDREARKAIIAREARTLCEARNLELVEDAGLLEEVAGLAEWPVVTMRTHQRYFAVRDPKAKTLAPHFITVANVEASDGGAEIVRGNAKVLSARLNDARFFWDLDRKKGLEDPERLAKLDQIVFHQKLGSIGDKVRRIEALAAELAPIVGADVELVRRAARLCKADLVTETVGEFPELQGQIGRQLAELAGEHASVAIAIEDHYRPLGPNDRVPTDKVAICVALADKADTLVAFWKIDEKPTGSGDPYGLRRAALGFIRIVLENNIRLSFWDWLVPARTGLGESRLQAQTLDGLSIELVGFVQERLRVALRDKGAAQDLLSAVINKNAGDVCLIVARVEALEGFLKTDDGKNLLAGYRRAANILAAEEKKGALGDVDLAGAVDARLLKEPAEQALAAALDKAAAAARKAVEKEDFAGAMSALAALRAPVDAFFEAVLVNAEDKSLRANRLRLLHRIRDSLGQVADFSRIEG